MFEDDCFRFYCDDVTSDIKTSRALSVEMVAQFWDRSVGGWQLYKTTTTTITTSLTKLMPLFFFFLFDATKTILSITNLHRNV